MTMPRIKIIMDNKTVLDVDPLYLLLILTCRGLPMLPKVGTNLSLQIEKSKGETFTFDCGKVPNLQEG